MSDWAAQEAARILQRVWATDCQMSEIHAWLAGRLRLVHNQGVKEGVARMGAALNNVTERPKPKLVSSIERDARHDVRDMLPSDCEFGEAG